LKIITVTDAWTPQVNGVVRTIEASNRELQRAGHAAVVIGPDQFLSVPCPGYAEIRLAVLPRLGVARRLAAALAGGEEVAVHVATEGPLGRAASRWCRRHEVPFSTAYHTRFPQFLQAMYRVPEAWTYAAMRRFHREASVVMAPTPTVARELREHGIDKVALWTRGVDTDRFRPALPLPLDLPKPIFLYVGRVSVEKNIGDFLTADLPGSKVVAGEGPALPMLKRRFPEAHYLGILPAAELARLYSTADVFVFPSRSDTFGLVLLEALACGTPVAAYPVQGPADVIGRANVGVMHEDLRMAALAALKIDRGACRDFALEHSWAAATRQFLGLQRPVRFAHGRAPAVSGNA
jgi:glycosyltransferase involved in cell wall biosynthesis